MEWEEAIARVTAPGQPFALTEVEIGGVRQTVFQNAPSSLRALFDGARARGDDTFLVYEDEVWSFDAVMTAVDELGAVLVERYGVAPGDRVAIGMRNYPEWIVAFAAIVSVGGIAVCLNAWWTEAELAYGLEDCGARVLVAAAASSGVAGTSTSSHSLRGSL